VLRRGTPAPDDPQHDLSPPPMKAIQKVDVIHDGQTLQVGPLH
jgi:hypothetical protein